MRYALFLGCQIPARVKQYEKSVRAVCEHVDIQLQDNRQFNCCGYPMRNSNPKAFLLSAVKNLALSEKMGLDMLVLCKCCYGSLKKAEYIMKDGGEWQDEVLMLLKREGLAYEGKTHIHHFLSVLYHKVDRQTLKEKIIRPYKGLKIATHYGCHALRPSQVTGFDNPIAPSLFDELVSMTGAVSIDWPKKLECCGAPAMGVNNDLSKALMVSKLVDGKSAGAHYICTACPYCQIQFDDVQHAMGDRLDENGMIPAVLYPQLLGLAMGLNETTLGIDMNQIDISGIRSYISEE
ncbi:MAG: CoB--CoM heterodisulfide reductase iron-sulfur subunit B family protein [Deltaproteobacteria bacterium]|nr:CoB--CoM heterodisulfide reductase iron-sulfur subunit B family protein [Deltaproteobacteria bacterium]